MRLPRFKTPRIAGAYIIYDADVMAESASFIERMSPAVHMPAGHNDAGKAERKRIGELFTETEGDEQYDYGYMGKESGHYSWFPFGYVDDGDRLVGDPYQLSLTDTVTLVVRHTGMDRLDALHQLELLDADTPSDGEPPEIHFTPDLHVTYVPEDCEYRITDDNEPSGLGQHRKWVGMLTYDEWLIFADSYMIDLHDDGVPVDAMETMGSITEYGHISAICVDNREGWESYGSDVIDSQMYVSFTIYPTIVDMWRRLFWFK